MAKNVAKKAPYAWKTDVRPWMVKQGYLTPGQHGHHWAIPQNGWGKNVPDWLKNQPGNIKAMPDAPAVLPDDRALPVLKSGLAADL